MFASQRSVESQKSELSSKISQLSDGLKRWRSSIEGRISCLKRRFGLNRSMLSGYRKTQIWTGLGIFAHNLRQAAKLMV